MAKIVLYTKDNCHYCVAAKNLLTARQASYEEVRIDQDAEARATMERLSGRRTVPQIFINEQAIGGFDDLSALAQSGKLNDLLK